ncbi:hypothetical protein Xvie_03034 [Xenorhabdus vietnamensis]|uniref:Uncharacterized protein n=1 Tax=Xenorhabdus vietnamensis TaxID=351656 RepID=A0A1Y2S985_9GAMM|nr:hypothetical protein [Xenorhabdus vietnamensis]OTA15227.1 hypothetical protein Xvie_03034 [Xenorhabdus vietnamensis]
MINSKFLKVKKWIDLNEAAIRLSSSLEENVTTLDLLELGLDGELKLSVRLPYAGKYIFREAWEEDILFTKRLEDYFLLTLITNEDKSIKKGTEKYQVLLNEYMESEFKKYVERMRKNNEKEEQLTREYFNKKLRHVCWEYSSELSCLDEYVFELMMIGTGRIDVMSMIEVNKNRNLLDFLNLDGVFLKAIDGKIYNLMERFSDDEIKSFDEKYNNDKKLWRENYLNPKYYFPTDGVPANTEFGITPENLFDFERKLLNESGEYASDQLLYLIGGVLNCVTSRAKKWTQGEMALTLSDKGIRNLSERKINEIFSKSNKIYKSIN